MPKSVSSKLSKMLIDAFYKEPQLDSMKFFIVKVTNYELLSIMLDRKILESIIMECRTVICNTLVTLDENYHYDTIVCDQYIVFSSGHKISQASEKLAFLLYNSLQLHIFSANPSSILEYKISSFKISGNILEDNKTIQNILTELVLKDHNGFYVPFNSWSIEKLETDSNNIIRFKKALIDNSISFAYQPIIDRITGEVPYYECLLRIPEHKIDRASAGPYIILSENIGLNNILDQIVLKMAITELEAAKDIHLAINISNSGILDNNLKELALSMLSDRSIAERLIIEVTETSLNIDFDKTKDFLDAIRLCGCKIALDDFGAGFTSFKQLQKLPLDIIKIDGSFIKSIILNDSSKFLVKALIELAMKLGAKTVAEFVENAEIAKFLLDVEIDYMQGNFFSPAMNQRLWNK